MKDITAREKIGVLRNLISGLEEKISDLTDKDCTNLKIRHCPKCKHDTLQQEASHGYGGFFSWNNPLVYYNFKCLVCGSKLLCTKEYVVVGNRPKKSKG